MSSQSLKDVIAASPIARLHGLRPGQDGTSVELVATVQETGANGRVNETALTLVLLAASHAVYTGSSIISFTVHPTPTKASVGDLLVGTARIDAEQEGSAKISATVKVGDQLIASAEIHRRR